MNYISKMLLGTAVATLLAGSAWSQTGTVSQGSNRQVPVIDEIVVTALKRSTNLQETAAAVEVVSSESLDRINLTDIADIANLAPSLNFGKGNGIYTTITMRGVSSQDTTELGGPAVSFSIDGESINRPLNLSASLFDVDRIEVLKGPQGTLYGRNATAGAINIITHRPEDSFSAALTGIAGNYDQRGLQGYINIPATDWLAIRLSGIYSEHEGYTDTERGSVLDDEDLTAGRIHALFTPTDNLSALLTYEAIETAGGGPSTSGVFITGTPGELPTEFTEPPNREEVIVGTNPNLHTEQEAVRAEISYDFGWAVLTDIAAYRTTEFEQQQNILGTPVWTIDFLGSAEYETFGNELRLSNGGDSSFDWQVGYYYFDEDQEVASNVSAPLPFAVRDESGFLRRFVYPNVNAKSEAIFGEVTVPVPSIAEGFSLTAGLRQTWDEKSRVGTQFALDIGPFIGSGGAVENYIPIDQSGKVENDELTYTAGFNWQWSPDNLLFAKVSTGYNAGGFTTENVYGPETLEAYEIGSKNAYFDDRFFLNFNLFYYDYTDQQIQVLQATPTGSAQSIQNAGASRTYGLEIDGSYAFTPDSTFRFSVNYLDAEFTEYTVSTTTIGTTNVTVDLEGSTPQNSPRLTLTAGYTHDWHGDWGSLTADIHTAYKSDYYLAVPNYSSAEQQAYFNTDLSLTYRSYLGTFDVTAFVRNIEDERRYQAAQFFSAPGTDVWLFQFTNPRTYGVRATVWFD